MKLLEKLEKFKKKDISGLLYIEKAQLPEIEIKQNQFIEKCIFEINASLNSMAINQPYRVFVGAYSYMNGGGYLRSNIFIGRYCSIGRRVTIGAGMHNIDGLSSSPFIKNGTSTKYTEAQLSQLSIKKNNRISTIIMSDVWIGDGAVILPGVTVGIGAVIGANSVVTRDIPPYAIVGGCPAKLIRYRFPENIISDLIRSEWWELSKKELEELPTGNVIEFIEFLQSKTLKSNSFEFHSYYIRDAMDR